ncbi:hypothetical protein COV94_05635, partial [Candidatus Woesearchaeota archaeon CG11_big_fil_rev_8_21_14_0_20_57_5]
EPGNKSRMDIRQTLRDQWALIIRPTTAWQDMQPHDKMTSIVGAFLNFAVLGLVVGIFPMVKQADGTMVREAMNPQSLLFGFLVFGILGLIGYMLAVWLLEVVSDVMGGTGDHELFAYYIMVMLPLFVGTLAVSHVLAYLGAGALSLGVFVIGIAYLMVIVYEGLFNVRELPNWAALLLMVLLFLGGYGLSVLV